ncbi:uncharacterized protein LOC118216063 isoform X1 [Anguilla anguilla]|uniref:uncharacterized protein LOC118216063 isoform X1 n=1 Tax=Anguilla anguilla TaxID=7936 RepID=UPI0015B1AD88|nr:uncharacterized protein LOC118216063 isoform X1 [Anguilla anguilla]
MARGLHPCRRTEKLKERQSEKEIRQGSRDLNSSEPNSLAIQEREKPNISHTNDQFFSTKNDSQLQTNLQPPLPYKHGRNIHPCTRGERALYSRDLAVRNCWWFCACAAWQCVLRDVRSLQSSERSLRGPQEYVEKNPNPALHSFTPVDLSDIRKRNSQDCRKS